MLEGSFVHDNFLLNILNSLLEVLETLIKQKLLQNCYNVFSYVMACLKKLTRKGFSNIIKNDFYQEAIRLFSELIRIGVKDLPEKINFLEF